MHSSPEDLFKVTYGRDLHAVRGVLAERYKVTFAMHMESNFYRSDHLDWFNRLKKQLETVAEPEIINFVNLSISTVDQLFDMLVLVQFRTKDTKFDLKSFLSTPLPAKRSKLIRLIFYEEKQEMIELINWMLENGNDDVSVCLLVRVSYD